jgi:pyruvate, water dikinase
MVSKKKARILWFKDLTIKDVPLVGGKNASLGEMYRELTKKGVRVPNGFAITAQSYREFVEYNKMDREVRRLLGKLKIKNLERLQSTGKAVRSLFLNADIPPKLEAEIRTFYAAMEKAYRKKNVDVAVRSSATAEDLPDASFAGQQETYLNVQGIKSLLEACKKCFASLFTNRAIIYRQEKGFGHFDVYLSIGVQKMVKSTSSGVMFTIDTESGFKDVIMINGAYGLGENVVQGAVNPDEFFVYKGTLGKYKPIINRKLGSKHKEMLYSGSSVKNKSVALKRRQKFCISDKEVLQLAKWGVIIEDHYTAKRKKATPMDIEWGKDSTGLFILQARPETVQSQKTGAFLEEFKINRTGTVLAAGAAVGNKIGAGKAHVIKSVADIKKFRKGEVLVTSMTDPDWVPIMKIASAIVTDRGGKTCHAAIVSRELGIPCIVGTINGTKKIKNGESITVNCAGSDEGVVYKGLIPYKRKVTKIANIPTTKTTILLNLGDPSRAFSDSFLPVKGIGLARLEFIINSHIKIHPLALINFSKLDSATKKKIAKLTIGYKSKPKYFVDKLAEGVAMLAAAFYPREVIVRMSDFKSNEYAQLIGGKGFEPTEDNPMIGWRGASRYYSKAYRPAFDLECQAMKKVREEMGLSNVKLMIPFCRTPEEGKKVIKILKDNGLKQGKNGLEVYVMCELPSNVILAEEYAEIFDGFSIGSNDLTQTILAVDRDSELVASIFDERHRAVKIMLASIIKTAKEHGVKIGICGDSVSTYPELARFVADCGIDSMSLTSDVVMKTVIDLAKYENRRKSKKNFSRRSKSQKKRK